VASRRLPTRAIHMLERNVMAYRHHWIVLLTGFVEPVLYLLGIGFGIGSLVRNVPIGHGQVISYAMFVAPALMASSAMNGAIYESTFNLFYKLRYVRSFDAIIATPVGIEDATVGEIIWAVGRGSLYSVGFLVLMLALGLVASPWAILAIPAAILVGFAFAALGSVITTFMRSWQDFDGVQLGLQPMFLFSATFFPITVYPPALQMLVEVTPLYRGIDLIRGLTTGAVGVGQFVDVAYLVLMGIAGVTIAAVRLRRRLLK
ncbi:MAG TPA: ABC transporter permease, partial [Candidatus Nitrosopolaris sp.]|nr:ABC transporter permease [Candidatus Nitrosopolaris sp.]